MVMGEISTGCDVLVIGAGPGGYEAALHLARHGKDVILVDKNYWLGGVCLQHGCIPSKALISASEVYEKLRDGNDMGISASDVKIDIKKLQEWKTGVITKLTKDLEGLLKMKGVSLYKAEAIFENSNTVKISGSHELSAVKFKHCIIATGSSPVEISTFKYDEKKIASSRGALNFNEVPKEAVIIGGGYIGMEMGMVYAGLGSKVHILEATSKILGVVDDKLAEPVISKGKEMGIEFHTDTLAKGWKPSGKRVVVEAETNGKKKRITCDLVMVAVGRRPSSKGFGIERTNVEITDRGFIKVDEFRKTTEKNIYAIGDVAGDPMLAHKARRDAFIAANNILGIPDKYDNLAMPAVIFTNPEIASVGMSINDCKKARREIVIGEFSFGHLGRALAADDCQGFMRVIVDKASHLILGVDGVGPRVSDLISEASLAIEMGAYAEDIVYTVHAHPTFPEALMEACHNALDKLK